MSGGTQPGGESTLAPRPKKASFARSIYDAIEANGGAATTGQILRLVGATDDAYKWNSTNRNTPSMRKKLQQTARAGYVTPVGKDKWTLGSLGYWDRAQQHIEATNGVDIPDPGPVVRFRGETDFSLTSNYAGSAPVKQEGEAIAYDAAYDTAAEKPSLADRTTFYLLVGFGMAVISMGLGSVITQWLT